VRGGEESARIRGGWGPRRWRHEGDDVPGEGVMSREMTSLEVRYGIREVGSGVREVEFAR